MTINELNKKDITYKNQLNIGNWETVEMKMAEFIISAKTKFNNQQPFIQKQYPNKTIHGFFNNSSRFKTVIIGKSILNIIEENIFFYSCVFYY